MPAQKSSDFRGKGIGNKFNQRFIKDKGRPRRTGKNYREETDGNYGEEDVYV
jgi:hypothetical protein